MNSGSTPERLRLAARRLFAERGYAGSSIRDITGRAHANLGAVTYHFGTKRALYHAVLAEFATPLADAVTAAATADAPAGDRIEAVMRVYFDHFGRQPEVPAMMIHEMAHGRPLPPPIRGAMRRILPTLVALIEAGQREGSIRSGPPIPFIMSLLAQPFYFTMIRRALTEIAGPATDRPEFRGHLIQHAVAFARRGLAPGEPAS